MTRGLRGQVGVARFGECADDRFLALDSLAPRSMDWSRPGFQWAAGRFRIRAKTILRLARARTESPPEFASCSPDGFVSFAPGCEIDMLRARM